MLRKLPGCEQPESLRIRLLRKKLVYRLNSTRSPDPPTISVRLSATDNKPLPRYPASSQAEDDHSTRLLNVLLKTSDHLPFIMRYLSLTILYGPLGGVSSLHSTRGSPVCLNISPPPSRPRLHALRGWSSVDEPTMSLPISSER